MSRIIRDSIFNQENYWRPLAYAGTYAAGADVALTPPGRISASSCAAVPTRPLP